MKLEDCKEAFHWDGSWRDVYVSNTRLEHWDLLFEMLRNYPCTLRYTVDGELMQLPVNSLEVFEDNERSHSLSIDMEGITVVAHFFGISEMEFDIDPREISSQDRLNRFIEFILALGEKLRKNVRVTEENAPEEIWFRYTFDTGKLNFELPNWILKKRAKINN